MTSDDEDFDCPLCMEEMDISDRNFKPCPCGYQVLFSIIQYSLLTPRSVASAGITSDRTQMANAQPAAENTLSKLWNSLQWHPRKSNASKMRNGRKNARRRRWRQTTDGTWRICASFKKTWFTLLDLVVQLPWRKFWGIQTILGSLAKLWRLS